MSKITAWGEQDGETKEFLGRKEEGNGGVDWKQ